MKIKAMMVVVLLLLAPCLVGAEVFTLSASSNATGAKTAVWLAPDYKAITCDATLDAATNGTVRVRVEGNQGGSAYDPSGMADVTLTSAQVTALIGTFTIIEQSPVKRIRANYITLGGGNSYQPYVEITCNGGR